MGTSHAPAGAGEVMFTAPETRTDIPTTLACTCGAKCSVNSPSFWSDYQLPLGRQIGHHHRHERWGRLAKRSPLAGKLRSADLAQMPMPVCGAANVTVPFA